MSNRKAFEKVLPLPAYIRWSQSIEAYVFAEDESPDSEWNKLFYAWQKGLEWQAAIEQGVPDELEVNENDTRDTRYFSDGWNACRASILVNKNQD